MLRAFHRPCGKTLTPVSSVFPSSVGRTYVTALEGTPAAFDKVLIANRGEIACRVIRSARKLGIKSVAVYSDADANAMHTQMADEAFHIGPPEAAKSYLLGKKILGIAQRTGAQAIHPGYGFLSENADFADQCEQADVAFIGPPSSAIRKMGSKSESKRIMESANVPVVPGYHGDNQSDEHLLAEAEKIQFPVLIKAVMGGGGKGMRIARSKDEFIEQLRSAQKESMNAFGDDRVLVEKYITVPRHIEIQVFADKQGNTVYLFERDCSVQRRHQKVLEESPAPGISEELRRKMGESAVAAAKAVGYVGAGTVEFIVDAGNQDEFKYYFMEMNTRLQVEHPVTEMVTGQDLVEWQLQVAAGGNLPATQAELSLQGHAIEARIYAENPKEQFLPVSGKISHLKTPKEVADEVRVDTGVRDGDEVSMFYDPMIAKLIVHGNNRPEALKRLKSALDDYEVAGLPTNIDFLRKTVMHPKFMAGGVDTNFIDENSTELLGDEVNPLPYFMAAFSMLRQELASQPKSPWEKLSNFRLNSALVRKTKFILSEDEHVVIDIKCDPLNPSKFTMQLNHEETTFQAIRDLVGKEEFAVQEATMPINSEAVTTSVDTSSFAVSIGDTRHKVTTAMDYLRDETQITVFSGGNTWVLKVPRVQYESIGDAGSLLSPMPGTISKVMVKPGQRVAKGDPLIQMEAMKVLHTIRAVQDGIVKKVHFKEGEGVKLKTMLVEFEADSE